ncbi:MAG: hypothetical protein J0L53_07225 [Spirochaetes bacterium]|nr:hypothetical protein [Spirochaetota bacterium]
MFIVKNRAVGDGTRVTMKHTTLVKDTDEGKPIKISAANTVVLASADDPFVGIVEAIESGVCTVNFGRCVRTLKYSSTAPGLNSALLECDGAGGVRVDGTNGQPFTVLEVNTTDTEVTLAF